MKIKPFHVYLSLLGIIGILIFLFLNPKLWYTPEKPYTEYTTDTIYSEKSFSEGELTRIKKLIEEGIKTNPSTITYYKPEYIDRVETIEVIPDSLLVLVDDLQDSLEIAWDYLAQFPKQPKLLSLDLVKDSISLGLLSINGKTKKETYPIFLDEFQYTYDGSSMSRSPNRVPKKVFKGDDFRVLAGYSLLGKYPYTGASYSIGVGKFSVGATSILTIQEQPQLLLLTGVSLKLDK